MPINITYKYKAISVPRLDWISKNIDNNVILQTVCVKDFLYYITDVGDPDHIYRVATNK